MAMAMAMAMATATASRSRHVKACFTAHKESTTLNSGATIEGIKR
jgi:hypothetical protein